MPACGSIGLPPVHADGRAVWTRSTHARPSLGHACFPRGFSQFAFKGVPRKASTNSLAGNELTRGANSSDATAQRSGVKDPFITAGLRLQKLLEDVEDEGENLRQGLLGLSIGSRLTLLTNVSTLLLAAAIVINIITQEDLLGGMSLSSACLSDALLGAAYSLPLMATSGLGRMSRVRRSFPVLDALHDCQERVLEPMAKDLDAPQLLIVCSAITLPLLMLMLPAMHGSVMSVVYLLQVQVLTPAGLHLPGSISTGLDLLIPVTGSSYLAAFMVARQLAVKRNQYQAIHSAMTHADRYFRLTESMALQSGDTALHSQRTSAAFKTVSVMWIMMRQKVCQLSCVLTALNVCYLSMIWQSTGDLWTPFMAALPWLGLEMLMCRRSLAAKALARSKVQSGEM